MRGDGGVGWFASEARAGRVALVDAARAPGVGPLAASECFRELQRRHLFHLGFKVEMVGSGRFLVG